MSDPADAVMDLIFGRWRSQTLYAGVRLGIFEALAGGPASSGELARQLDLDPDNTYRLLRALGSLSLLDEGPDGIFELTERGSVLTDDHPRSLRGVALLEESPEHYEAWTHLLEVIREGGKTGFERAFGHSPYEHREVDPAYAEVFDEAMTSGTRVEADAVLEALDDRRLAELGHLCDVGGGRGYLLGRLLAAHPHLTGEVLELPGVVEQAGAVPAEMGVEDRLTFTPGDMFEAVPEADGYLLKYVLMDWPDATCVDLLENVREAAAPGAPVYLVEMVVPGPEAPHVAKLLDLHMLVATGGRQRTVEEFAALFRRADIEPAGHHLPEAPPVSVVEGRAG